MAPQLEIYVECESIKKSTPLPKSFSENLSLFQILNPLAGAILGSWAHYGVRHLTNYVVWITPQFGVCIDSEVAECWETSWLLWNVFVFLTSGDLAVAVSVTEGKRWQLDTILSLN